MKTIYILNVGNQPFDAYPTHEQAVAGAEERIHARLGLTDAEIEWRDQEVCEQAFVRKPWTNRWNRAGFKIFAAPLWDDERLEEHREHEQRGPLAL